MNTLRTPTRPPRYLRLSLKLVASLQIFPFMSRACRCDGDKRQLRFLADLLAATEGRRLRQKEWCRQLAESSKLNGVLLGSDDEVGLMAYRPRVMLSQLHNLKRRQLSCSSLEVPSKVQMLTGLVIWLACVSGKQTDPIAVTLPLVSLRLNCCRFFHARVPLQMLLMLNRSAVRTNQSLSCARTPCARSWI